MINNRMISAKSVIAKVISDLDLKESEIKITDIKEWIMEAILRIGAITLYEHKVAVLPVTGHLAVLPCDLYKLGLVAFSFSNGGGWLPMRKSTSSFGVYRIGNQNKPTMLVLDDLLIPLVKQMFKINEDKDALLKLNEDKELRSTLSKLLNNSTEPTVNGRYVGQYDKLNGLQYMTKPGYIMTNIPEGFVKIEYYAIYTDEESMPMIPDMESYKESIFWYVTMKLLYIKRLRGKVTDKLYYDAQTSWNFYRKLAYVEALMPKNVDELETISNTWTKLYPEINDLSTFMNTTGEELNIYNWD